MNYHVQPDSRGDNKQENGKEGFPSRVSTCRQPHSQDRVIPREYGLPSMVSSTQLFILQIFIEYIAHASTCGDTTVNKVSQVPSLTEFTLVAREIDNEYISPRHLLYVESSVSSLPGSICSDGNKQPKHNRDLRIFFNLVGLLSLSIDGLDSFRSFNPE